MNAITVLVAALTFVMPVLSDVTGTNPSSGDCLCMNNFGVNVRDSPCGNVLGTATTGQCYVSEGGKVGCTMSGTYYEFFSFTFGGTTGWAAGEYLNLSPASSCSGSADDSYTCQISDEGRRIHETTSPTPYDCVDSNCQNTCQGGQCVAYVTCRCTRNGNWAPGTNCWRPGTFVRRGDGTCNSDIPVNTAIATFDSNGDYYAGHAAVFVGCADAYTIRAYDQWCCKSIGYTNYPSSHSYYSTFAVITNPSCADRSSWSCRSEAAGSTCCNTWYPACVKSDTYYSDDA